jgi:YesN/AraC family two-component response regulator
MGPSVIILPEHTYSMNASLRDLIRMEREVVASVVQGQYSQAGEKVKELLLEASRLLQRSEAIVGLLVHLVGDLDYSLQEYGMELTEVIESDALGQVYSLSRLEELQSWMEHSILQPVKQRMESMQVTKKKKSVQYTIAYVQEQLEKDLSLQQIADHIHIPRPTLSKWFKEETREDFREYLIRLRMQKAMDLLQNRDIGIKEIAERLRYTSVPNFTRIFKQFTGMTPGAFRIKAEGGLQSAESIEEGPPD